MSFRAKTCLVALLLPAAYAQHEHEHQHHMTEGAGVDHRQDLPRAYRPNGSIYAIHVPVLRAQRTFYPRATAPYVMPREASVNIDTELDFGLTELLLAGRRARSPLRAP